MLDYVTRLMQDPELNIMLNKLELAKFGFEQLSVDNTERFFKSGSEMNAGQAGMGGLPINAGQGAMGVNPQLPTGLPVQPNNGAGVVG
jgi:hypothetical protein